LQKCRGSGLRRISAKRGIPFGTHHKSGPVKILKRCDY
jgi:hypothetical protein